MSTSSPDNPIANTALAVINARKASAQAKANTGTMYQRSKFREFPYDVRNETLEWEPVFTQQNEDTPVDQYTKTELQVLSCLAGIHAKSAAQVDRQIRFVGFLRGETNNEHVKGNANGSLAVICRGVLTVLHSGVEIISPGALVCIRAPTEAEAEQQVFVGRIPGKPILMLEEYKPELDAMEAKTAFSALMVSLGVRVNARTRAIPEEQAEAFHAWWIAERTSYAIFTAVLAGEDAKERNKDPQAARTKAYKEMSTLLGLIGNSPNIELQKELLRRLFTMNVVGELVDTDVNQLIFPFATSGSTVDPNNTELARRQASAVQNKFNSIISCHAKKQNSIIGKTPSGGYPGGSIDLVMWKI